MARVRFVANRRAERALTTSPRVHLILGRASRQVLGEARRLSDSERYRNGLEAEVDRDIRGRLVGRVNANWWASGFVEFGTVNRPPEAPLRRALDSLRGLLR